jgi:hypothetical protein
MNPTQQTQWKDAVLGEILRAVSAHGPLRESLVFKGARILNLHLHTQRQSLDIDANLRVEFQQEMPDHQAQVEWFEGQLSIAIRNHYEDQDPVRYELESVKVVKNPSGLPHPRGWDGLIASIRVNDQKMRGVRSLPTVELEIASPEKLGPDAVCNLPLDGTNIPGYALHRIAGEKLRAFLTSLPAYRGKINSSMREVRAKDLHDLTRILDARPITDEKFWENVSQEFQLACESRYVDCAGPETFREEWGKTQAVYEAEANLTAVPWVDAEQTLNKILEYFSGSSVFPLSYPLEKSDDLPDSSYSS